VVSGAWGVDCGPGVERRKRGAVEEMGRRAAGGEERIGREESGRESGYSSSGFCSFACSEDEDRRRRLGLRSEILYSSSADRCPWSRPCSSVSIES
jgi:hypothetical protein